MKVVFACNPSPVYVNGHVVVMGQHWPADDPVVREHPGLFTEDARYGLSASVAPPPEDDEEADFETTTAAPGEKRTTRRRNG